MTRDTMASKIEVITRVQAIARGALYRENERIKDKAVGLLQKDVRAKMARQEAAKKVEAVAYLQALIRGTLVREGVGAKQADDVGQVRPDTREGDPRQDPKKMEALETVKAGLLGFAARKQALVRYACMHEIVSSAASGR